MGCKGTKSREQNKTNGFVFFAEMEYLREFYSQRYEKSREIQTGKSAFISLSEQRHFFTPSLQPCNKLISRSLRAYCGFAFQQYTLYWSAIYPILLGNIPYIGLQYTLYYPILHTFTSSGGFDLRLVQVIVIVLHAADSTGFLARFTPTGVVAVHQGVEAGVVAGFQQMTQFVDNHMFYAPCWQEQQIGGEADRLVSDVAHAPARNHRLVVE